MKFIRLFVVAFSLMTFQIQQAHAIFVFDPSNFVQNTTSATMAVKNEINTSLSAINNVKQTIMMVKQLTSINGLAQLTGLQEELRLYQDLAQTSTDIRNTLNQATQLGNDVKAQFGSSNTSLKTFFSNANRNNLDRAQAMMNRFESINSTMAQSNKKRQMILDKLSVSDGSLAASTQATTAAVSVVIDQQNQMIAALGTQIAMAAQDKIDDSNKKDLADKIWTEHQDSIQKTAEKYKKK
jgi:conjugal transfer/entry exclusion protein